MSRFSLDADEIRGEFEKMYISDGKIWMVVNKGEDPFSPFIKDYIYLIYVSYFMEAELRLPNHPSSSNSLG